MSKTDRKTRIVQISMLCVIFVGLLIYVLLDYQTIVDSFNNKHRN